MTLHIRLHIVTFLLPTILLLGCRHKDTHLHTDAVLDRAAVPVLDATDVVTLISDSGITRYRITTPHWLVFDKADPAHWTFPKGVYLEQFSQDLQTNASLQSDYAYYDEDAQQWTLRGNVHALNLQGEQFDTPELIWNQKTETIHSDSSIVITKKQSIIHGVGFRSNNDMSRYTILHPTGVIPIEEE